MKKILALIFSLLLVAGAAHAIVVGFSGPQVEEITYDVHETFEGSGSDLTWTTSDGIDFDDSTTVTLEGSETCQMNYETSGIKDMTHVFSSAFSGKYFSCILHFTDTDTNEIARNFDIFLLDSEDSSVIRFALWDDDGDGMDFSVRSVGDSIVSLVDLQIAQGDTLYIGGYYKKDSGATDGEVKFWFSETAFTSDWGAADAAETGQSYTADIDKMHFVLEEYGAKINVDDIRIHDAQTAY